MQAAEASVESITREIARLDALLADAELYARDPARAKSASVERGQLAKRLAEAEEIRLAATDAYEQAANVAAADAG